MYASIHKCVHSNFDHFKIIPLAFLDQISTPIVNFANAGDNCTTFAGTQLLDCPQIEYVYDMTRRMAFQG